jgi:hypothetical protein
MAAKNQIRCARDGGMTARSVKVFAATPCMPDRTGKARRVAITLPGTSLPL